MNVVIGLILMLLLLLLGHLIKFLVLHKFEYFQLSLY